jgi:transcription termination/antitermination protein NusA
MEDLVRFNPKTQLMLTEAKEVKKKVKIGEILEIDLPIPGDFGRMAAQTAKQVVIQKLREAERNSAFDELKEQEGKIVQGIVQRQDRSGSVIIDLGKVTGILSQSEQIRREQYRPGNRLRFYIVSVEMGNRGPEIILSRADKRMVQVVFEQEIPEVASGEVEIKAIARDSGNRSKVAVFTADDTIDPIGSCIGQRGSRITTIIDELGGEKIDVIQYSEDAEDFIKHALSPAKVARVELNEETKEAVSHVAEDQFSLAIGRGGQNVRLAAELTGWKINVQQEGGDKQVSSEDSEDSEDSDDSDQAAVRSEQSNEEEKSEVETPEVSEEPTPTQEAKEEVKNEPTEETEVHEEKVEEAEKVEENEKEEKKVDEEVPVEEEKKD